MFFGYAASSPADERQEVKRKIADKEKEVADVKKEIAETKDELKAAADYARVKEAALRLESVVENG